MGTPKPKVHYLEQERFLRLQRGEPQVSPCGVTVTLVGQVVSDLSLLPQRVRCSRCSRYRADGPIGRLRAIEELALSSEDDTVSVQDVLRLIRPS